MDFQPQHMIVTIRFSKTDQYRQGNQVLIAISGSPTCPVAMLEQYAHLAAIDTKSDLRLFRGLVHTKKGMSLRKSGGISYTRISELVKDKLSSLGYDMYSKQLGLHSFRAGGAMAAANAQVKDRLFTVRGMTNGNQKLLCRRYSSREVESLLELGALTLTVSIILINFILMRTTPSLLF